MTRTPENANTNIGRTRTHRYRNLTDEEIAERFGVEYASPEFQRRVVADGGPEHPEDARRFTPERAPGWCESEGSE